MAPALVATTGRNRTRDWAGVARPMGHSDVVAAVGAAVVPLSVLATSSTPQPGFIMTSAVTVPTVTRCGPAGSRTAELAAPQVRVLVGLPSMVIVAVFSAAATTISCPPGGGSGSAAAGVVPM